MSALPPPRSPAPGEEVATFAAGCFWCSEAVFSELKGVRQVLPGYSGGTVPNPSYEDVCTGATGHAETVEILFDPKEISYRDLLTVFFATHDPTTMNRQGNDVGTQYRSAIFFHDERQRREAEEAIASLEREKVWRRPIVTQVVPFEKFYPAEEYHREYFLRNPERGYCQLVIAPKMSKFRAKYAKLLRPRTAP